MNVLRTSGAAVEHLAIHYSCAHDVLGNEDLRVLYDGACRLGYPDCSKLFSETESRLAVNSFNNADMYRQLTKIWKAKGCHAVKLLVTDLGSPASTIAMVMAKLLGCGVIPHTSFVRTGRRSPDSKGNRTAVIVGFTSAEAMGRAIREIAQRPRPQQARSNDSWICSCSAKVWLSKANCYKCNAPNPEPRSVNTGKGKGKGKYGGAPVGVLSTTSAYMQFSCAHEVESDMLVLLGVQSGTSLRQTTVFRDDAAMSATQTFSVCPTGYGTSLAPHHERGAQQYWASPTLPKLCKRTGGLPAIVETALALARRKQPCHRENSGRS